ncbi:DUF1501 domain-containing protein [Actinomycetospora chiangmaiensis]|uniref:DUF1501 domain-containing protein n=1 Tax=Actinomycetospora chiangmaiensis TaxID=402650 RepID=UPI0003747635|nr:DUF1501 domain-containing protein [Actinomycetospora chiangmaiensis]
MSNRLPDVTRRRFLTWSGVAAAAVGLTAGATQVPWSTLLDGATHTPLAPGQGVLVVVTLYGGNDGLNTVVPASDDTYQAQRHELAYQPSEVLDVGQGLGLNPGLAGTKGLFDDGHVAIVRGVGYPGPDHSHFRSMAIWQTASPTSPTGAGWLGRWLDGTGEDPLRAVSLDSVLPPLLTGASTAASTLPAAGLSLPTGSAGAAFRALAGVDPGDDALRARVARSGRDLAQVEQVLGPTLASSRSRAAAGNDAGAAAAGGGRSQLADQLRTVAALVEARVPTRVYSVSLGGFDTHADERGTQQRLLTELDAALTPFVQRLGTTDAGRQVVTMVYSEFGRRVLANASQGTDHGTANPVFLLGAPVVGGLHGEQPSLTDLDAGDLRASTDFRDVYATVLGGVLGADPAPVLGAGRTPVAGLLAT